MKKILKLSCIFCACAFFGVSNAIDVTDRFHDLRLANMKTDAEKKIERIQAKICQIKAEQVDREERIKKIDKQLLADIQKTGDEELLSCISGRERLTFHCECTYLLDFLKKKGVPANVISVVRFQEQAKYYEYLCLFDKELGMVDDDWRLADIYQAFEYIGNQVFSKKAKKYVSFNAIVCSQEKTKALYDKFREDMAALMFEELKMFDKFMPDGDLEWTLIKDKFSPEKFDNLKSHGIIFSISTQSVALGVSQNLYPYLEKFLPLKQRLNDLNHMWLSQSVFNIESSKTINSLEAEVEQLTQQIPAQQEAIKKEKEAAKERWQNSLEKEIYDSSRAPTLKEKNDLYELDQFTRRHDIDETRIIDAETLINAMIMPMNEKVRLLNLLHNGSQEEIDAEVDQFLKESDFTALNPSYPSIRLFEAATSPFYAMFTQSTANVPVFKNSLIYHIASILFAGSRHSKVYRDEILTLIAWSRATAPALYDISEKDYFDEDPNCRVAITPTPYSAKRKLNFWSVDYGACACQNNVYINFAEKVFVGVIGGISPFPSRHGEAIYEVAAKTFFHEIGHIITMNIAHAIETSEVSAHSKSMVIGSESRTVERSKDRIEQTLARFRQLPQPALDSVREALEKLLSMNVKNNDDLFNSVEMLLTSDAMLERAMMHDIAEMMQIRGIFAHKYNGRNVLYLNKLSDASANAFAMEPFRTNHLGISIGSEDLEDLSALNFLLKNLVDSIKDVNINLSFYRALARAYGVDGKQYLNKVRYYSDQLNNHWILPHISLQYALCLMDEMAASVECPETF